MGFRNLATRLDQFNSVIDSFDDSNCLRTICCSFWLDCSPMAITAMFGKSAVIKILNRFWLPGKTLMFNTFSYWYTLICLMAIPGINTSIYWFIPLILFLGFFQFCSIYLYEYYFHFGFTRQSHQQWKLFNFCKSTNCHRFRNCIWFNHF